MPRKAWPPASAISARRASMTSRPSSFRPRAPSSPRGGSSSPFVVDGRLVATPTLRLTLTVDHRVLDGAPAAQFLGRIVRYLEQPTMMLYPSRALEHRGGAVHSPGSL